MIEEPVVDRGDQFAQEDRDRPKEEEGKCERVIEVRNEARPVVNGPRERLEVDRPRGLDDESILVKKYKQDINYDEQGCPIHLNSDLSFKV